MDKRYFLKLFDLFFKMQLELIDEDQFENFESKFC